MRVFGSIALAFLGSIADRSKRLSPSVEAVHLRALALAAQPRVVQRLPGRDADLPDRCAAREVAGAAVRVDPRFVEAGPEVVEAGLGIGEQVVDDGRRDDGCPSEATT